MLRTPASTAGWENNANSLTSHSQIKVEYSLTSLPSRRVHNRSEEYHNSRTDLPATSTREKRTPTRRTRRPSPPLMIERTPATLPTTPRRQDRNACPLRTWLQRPLAKTSLPELKLETFVRMAHSTQTLTLPLTAGKPRQRIQKDYDDDDALLSQT